ncbi:hypothetical protein HU200_015231 [Digitaria exilis]|uniref:F-box domain-containing protein n=1 Tax=Digitaria exilis TaxID=1010633 RepID=A0A835KKS2_9POAL|nr:hypothetical protein HU200_015231 [Digitaria exilis]
MMAATQPSPWSDLPPELMGLVLKQLPSLVDRVRVRAVCRSWRTNAQLQPLLPLPLPCGEIHRMTIPHEACYCGSIDNWLFLVHNDGGCSLVNPFSKTMLQLPKLDTIWHTSLDMSPNSLVAAMIVDHSSRSGICICQPPFATDIFRKNEYEHIHDIVFFNGSMYALISGKLVILEIVQNHKYGPQILSIKCICDNIDYLTCHDPSDPLHECGVFNMRNEMVKPLFPETAVVQRSVGHACPTWFFPSEAI